MTTRHHKTPPRHRHPLKGDVVSVGKIFVGECRGVSGICREFVGNVWGRLAS